jgi:cysteine rich repeat protein
MKCRMLPLSFLVISSLAVQAQDAPPAGAREACKPDMQKFCADVKPGGGRIIACLRDHKDQLSQACSDAMASAAKSHRPPATGSDSSGQVPPSKPQQ